MGWFMNMVWTMMQVGLLLLLCIWLIVFGVLVVDIYKEVRNGRRSH
jgi:hypothetical protein